MSINWTDVVVVVIALLFVRAGWKFGLISNLFSGIGLFGGFLVGVYLVERLYTPGSAEPIVAISAIGLMIGCGLIGNVVLSYVGRLFKVPEGLPQRINSILGALFGGVVALAAAWAIGFAITAAPAISVSQSVKDSRVLARIDSVMPQSAADQLAGLTKTITVDVFPRYLSPFDREVIVKVDVPAAGIVEIPAVRKAALSVAHVSGPSKCKMIVQGSGFVYAPGLVMTNAHVIAGVTEPTVTVNKREYAAVPIVFDPQLDIAVLKVKGLKTTRLTFADPPQKGAGAAVVGYPEGGELTASSARVRGVMRFNSPDIFSRGDYKREVISIRGSVLPGNSGGPLLSTSGQVLGMIFAASTSDPNTGYALSAEQLTVAAGKGYTSEKSVSTGDCV